MKKYILLSFFMIGLLSCQKDTIEPVPAKAVGGNNENMVLGEAKDLPLEVDDSNTGKGVSNNLFKDGGFKFNGKYSKGDYVSYNSDFFDASGNYLRLNYLSDPLAGVDHYAARLYEPWYTKVILRTNVRYRMKLELWNVSQFGGSFGIYLENGTKIFSGNEDGDYEFTFRTNMGGKLIFKLDDTSEYCVFIDNIELKRIY